MYDSTDHVSRSLRSQDGNEVRAVAISPEEANRSPVMEMECRRYGRSSRFDSGGLLGKLYNYGIKWQDYVVGGFRTIEQFSLERNSTTFIVVFPVMFDFSRYQWHWIHRKIAQEAAAHRSHIVDLFE